MKNYDKLMQEELNNLKTKPKLLLHSCCGPCSTAVIEKLENYFNITVIYYNPNIEPVTEYNKRKTTQLNYLKQKHIPYLDIEYDNESFRSAVVGLEEEEEGHNRCSKCFYLRLEKTALKALENNFDYFTTTLTISPHKNSQVINEIGLSLSTKYSLKYLVNDFKKNDGYKRSIELAKASKLYRQDYCGCLFSYKK